MPSMFCMRTVSIYGGASLLDRKRILNELLSDLGKDSPTKYSDHLFDSGKDVFANACTMQLEGIVSPSSAGLRVSSFGRPVRWRAG